MGDSNSITLDNYNNPHISYFSSSSDQLKYANYNDGSWNIEIVDSLMNGAGTSIAIDSSGNPHIAYCGYMDQQQLLKYAFYDGRWNILAVDLGKNPSLALDQHDNPHIIYYDHQTSFLKYASYDGSWNIENVDSGGWGRRSSLALDSYGSPHISYSIHYHGLVSYASFERIITSIILNLSDACTSCGLFAGMIISSPLDTL